LGNAEVSDDEPPSVYDDAPCGLATTSANGTFLRVNRTWSSWLGHTSDSLVGKRRFQELLTMGGRIFHQTHWAPLLQMQGSVSEVKLELLHRDGTTIPMVLNAQRRVHEQGAVIEIAAFVARDRDAYERELVRSRQRLQALVEESNRLQAEAKDHALAAELMIGIVSHDLRNPIASIKMAATLLSKHATPAQQATLNRLMRAAERTSALIADLLDFTQARLGAGLAISAEPVELHAAVGAVVDELTLAYPGRTLRHIREGHGVCQMDSNRLAQLIGNLVSNAMTYGTADVPVTVTSAVLADSFSISVHNAGAAIPAPLLVDIFKPLSRGEHGANKSRSVGLGLFIVSEIAKAHGGSATVTSSAEAGTTFIVVCPLAGPTATAKAAR
jgi:phosphoserine phosphatase RsbU/P